MSDMPNIPNLSAIKPYKFSSWALAQSFIERCRKIYMIILGDDDKFWIVTPADAMRLEKAGYQIAR